MMEELLPGQNVLVIHDEKGDLVARSGMVLSAESDSIEVMMFDRSTIRFNGHGASGRMRLALPSTMEPTNFTLGDLLGVLEMGLEREESALPSLYHILENRRLLLEIEDEVGMRVVDGIDYTLNLEGLL